MHRKVIVAVLSSAMQFLFSPGIVETSKKADRSQRAINQLSGIPCRKLEGLDLQRP